LLLRRLCADARGAACRCRTPGAGRARNGPPQRRPQLRHARRAGRHAGDPRREGRDRAARQCARLGARAGTAHRRRARSGTLLSSTAAPHQEHRTTRMAVLSVRALRKSYGERPVVDGVDFDIRPGECFGLLGPNGAGKTTTLKLCLGLIAPDSGSIELMGYEVPRHAREARHNIGVVPQFDNLDPDFTVIENLIVYGRYFGMEEAVIRARIPALLEFAGLASRGDTRIQTLSGGMKRRLTLARALINDPQLVLMDEPTTGLDPQARHVIWERLRQLRLQGKTILLTTHFMEEAERLCTRLVIMD